MTEHEFTQLLGNIDPALVARAEQSIPIHKKPNCRRALLVAAAVLFVMAMLLSVAAIAFFPKTYDLDYEIPKHENANKVAQIYYTTENGRIKKQSVLLPPTEQNVFMTWKHLCGLGDEIQMLDVIYGDEANWSGRYITVQLSTALREHPDSEALLDSLQKTLAHEFGVMKQNVSFIFNDTVPGPLQFYYDLQAPDPSAYPGAQLDITVGMINISDHDIVFTGAWSDFAPTAKLRENSILYTERLILPLPNESTTEIAEYRLAPGESREITYTFLIPKNAAIGAYDLIVSFKNQQVTFRKAVFVDYLEGGHWPGFVDYAEFHQFLSTHGFFTSTPSGFKASVAALTYNGVGLFDIMTPVPVELAEGYDGEEYTSELFSYTYLCTPDKSCRSCLTVYTLPDNMTLPYGITMEDTVLQALCKIGIDEQEAQRLLDEKMTVFFTNSALSSILPLSLRFDETRAYIVYENGGRSLALHFNKDGQSVSSIKICESHYIKAFSGPVSFVRYGNYAVNWELSEEQSAWLLGVLNQGDWVPGKPVEMYWPEETLLQVNDVQIYWSEGFFIKDGQYMKPDQEQCRTMDEICNSFPFFGSGPIEFAPPAESDRPSSLLTDQECSTLLTILNRGAWKKGALDLESEYTLTIAGEAYSYDANEGVFCNGEHYLVLSEEDQQTVNEIFLVYGIMIIATE